MNKGLLGLLRRGLGQIPGLLVLLTLGSLMAWGHHHKWKMPSLEELGLRAAPVAAPARRVEVVPGPADSSQSDTPAKIVFPSEGTVHKCGIETAVAEQRELKQFVAANGTVDFNPDTYADLATRAPGVAWRVFKKVGDPVKRGEVLAIVDSVEVGRAKSEFHQSLARVAARRRTLERMRMASEAIPPSVIQAAKAELRTAEIDLFNDQQTLLNLGLSIRLEDLAGLDDQEIVRRLRALGLPPELLSQVDISTLTANLLPLRSPCDGEVVERDVVPGEHVSATRPQFVVADIKQLWIILSVRQEDAPLVRRGQAAEFDTGHGGPVARGEVTWINRRVDKRTRTLPVRVEVDNTDGHLRPDTFGTGRILVHSASQALAVPTRALQRDRGAWLAFVQVEPCTFEVRRVTAGIRGEGLTQILHGVLPGEKVVTAGSHLLKSEIVRNRQQARD